MNYSRNYQEAKDCFEEALTRTSKNIAQSICYILLNQGELFYRLKDYAKASECYKKALEESAKALGINPRDSHAWTFQGICLYRIGWHEGAIRYLDKVIDDINPEFDLAWYQRGCVVDSETTFRASKYGNITANFILPPKVTLPEGYWNQLIGILLTVMIPAIIGWFVPSIAGWINGWRQRRNLGGFITKLSDINKQIQDKDKDDNSKFEYLESLEILQGKIQNALTRMLSQEVKIVNHNIKY